MRKPENLKDREFGKWTVIEQDIERKKRDKNTYWICVCECGVKQSVDATHLRKGHSVSCRKCSNHKPKGRMNSRIWSRMKASSKERGMEFPLGEDPKGSQKFLYDLIVKQEWRCALSGLPITFANTIKDDIHGHTTASVDRIHSDKPYTRDNVQWVHKRVNTMKMDLSDNEFIGFCEAVVKHRGNNDAISDYQES